MTEQEFARAIVLKSPDILKQYLSLPNIPQDPRAVIDGEMGRINPEFEGYFWRPIHSLVQAVFDDSGLRVFVSGCIDRNTRTAVIKIAYWGGRRDIQRNSV